jgi:hypothetical protein
VEPEQPHKRRWRVIASIVGAIATVASLVIGFIAILPILNQNASGVDKLDVAAEPYRPDDILVFSLSRDQIAALPPGDGSDACTPDQVAWLEANATEVPAYYFVTITNRATSGNVIGFSDIVGAGDTSTPGSASVLIECDQEAPNRIAPALVNASSGRPAYYDRSRMDDAGESPETPMIYNLQPGESGQFVLLVVSGDRFEGTIQYTVTSGADRATRDFELGAPVDLPGTRPAPARVFLAGDPFWGCALTADLEECLP